MFDVVVIFMLVPSSSHLHLFSSSWWQHINPYLPPNCRFNC